MNMSNQEKFIAFKTQKINDNEKLYGKEIRTKYGNDLINTSKQKVYALSKKEFDYLEQITKQISVQLKPLVGTTDFQQPAAKQLFTLHKEIYSDVAQPVIFIHESQKFGYNVCL